MQRYRNLAGDSGVAAYAIGKDFIQVRFVQGPIYTYTYASAGREQIEHMKALARAGRGLSSYIATTVRDGFASKSG